MNIGNMTIEEERYISLRPGTMIADRYEVIKCLGQGSMGLVYACRHKELGDHRVAVKVLFPEVARDATAAARFRNEIFASYDVSHPNVVRAYEYLKDGDLVAYTMEYVGGGDLAQQLESGQPLTIERSVEILCQMCAGVQAIHDAGIVHRDLKPENILLTKDGLVKIGDFGIARTGYGPKLTEHGGVVGTIDYVSPEYMLNSQVDWRSDIYAMGVLAFEMLTGRLPFKAESVYAAMTLRLKKDPPAPSSFNPACPPELDRIVLKALARDVQQRYQSAAEMFMQLEPLLAPNAVVPSGALMQSGRQRSAVYQGPQVTQMEQEDVDPRKVTAVMYNDRSSRTMTKQIANLSELQADEQHVDEIKSERAYAATQVIKKGANVDMDWDTSSGVKKHIVQDYYQATDIHMKAGDKTLSEGKQLSELEAKPSQIYSDATKIDNLLNQSKFSLWVEVITLIVAALVGIGFGFFLLKMFFPDLIHQANILKLDNVFAIQIAHHWLVSLIDLRLYVGII